MASSRSLPLALICLLVFGFRIELLISLLPAWSFFVLPVARPFILYRSWSSKSSRSLPVAVVNPISTRHFSNDLPEFNWHAFK